MRRSFCLGAALLALACGGSAVPASSEAPAATPPPSTADTAVKPAPANPPSAPVGAPVPGNPDEVRRITVADTDALRQQGRAVIVDVRDRGSYDSGHVAGAVHIPLDALVARMDELPRDKPIVTYCAWHKEATSARAALQLLQNGYADVSTLLGGIAAWRQAGLPVEP